MNFAQGIHRNVPMADYVADRLTDKPSLSKSTVKTIWERSVLHATHAHPRIGGHDDGGSRDADTGSAIHAQALGGASIHWICALGKDGVPVEDYRTKAAQEERDAARAEGLIPMLQCERPAVKAAAAVLDPYIGKDDTREATVLWQEPGVWLRCRPDVLSEAASRVVEIKTCTNAEPRSWCRHSLGQGGYDIQAALALRGLRAVTGEEWSYSWVVVETEAPHAVSVIQPSPAMITMADAKIAHAIEAWRRYLDTGVAVSYSPEPWIAMPASFETYDFEERMATR